MGAKIDYGNRMLFMDYVPRDESGTPVDPKTAGVMHLYKVVRALIVTHFILGLSLCTFCEL